VRPKFLADENIDSDLVVGLRRRLDDIDVVRVQEVGLRTVGDAAILQWAADQGRVLISHDLRTIPAFAGERLSSGLPMPGVILLRSSLSIAQAIDELAAIAGASEAEEWFNQIAYLPLRSDGGS
jgi:predicted nuclease of predicted toxin-antitoxin system